MRAVRMMSEGLRPVSAALLCPSWLASGADRGVDAASRIIPQTVHTHVRSDRGSPATGLDEWERTLVPF